MSLEFNAEEIMNKALEKAKEVLVSNPAVAEVILNQALKCFPEHHSALQLMAICKQQLERFDEAETYSLKALAIEPDCADNYNNLALSYAGMDKFQTAAEYLEKALELSPNNYLFLNNLALQYRHMKQHDKAIELCKKAIEISPSPELWSNLGGMYGDLKDMEKTEKCFRQSLVLDPTFIPAHVDLSFTYHLMGDWRRGFAEYEHRFLYYKQLKHYMRAYDQSKRWNGCDNLEGKTILLYGEQGHGDVIQFVRYCRYLKEFGATVIVHCANILSDLVSRVHGVDQVVVRDILNNTGGEFPAYDYQCSLMSLPHLLGLDYIPNDLYMTAKTKFELPEKYKDTFNIGVCWAGSPAHPNDINRSIPLPNFESICNVKNVRLFSLQVEPPTRMYGKSKKTVDFSAGGENVQMVDMRPLMQNFEDTATILSGLDLLISCDTAPVHLAGAMGVPCWVLIPYNPDWRWTLDGSKTAWYNSVRIFRQPTAGDWKSVCDEAAGELNALVLQNQR